MSDSQTADDGATFENLSQDEISRIVSAMKPKGPETERAGDSSEQASEAQADGLPPEDSAQASEKAAVDDETTLEVVAEMKEPAENTATAADVESEKTDDQTPSELADHIDGDNQTDLSVKVAGEQPIDSDHTRGDPQGEPAAVPTNDNPSVAIRFEDAQETSAETREAENDEDEDDGEEAVSLREMHPADSRRRYLFWLVGGTVGLVAVGWVIWWAFHSYDGRESETAARIETPSSNPAPAESAQLPSVEQNTDVTVAVDATAKGFMAEASIDDPVKQKLKDVLVQTDSLREELLIKRGQIEELKHHYQKGIAQVEAQVIDEKARSAVKNLDQALANSKLELALKTIQRRQLYIDCLDQPAGWLDFGSEELLHYTRRVDIALLAASVSDRVDIPQLIDIGQALNRRYRLNAEKLTVDLREEHAQPIKTIWQRIMKKEKQISLSQLIPAESTRKVSHLATESKTDDIAIWEEICNGNFIRKSEMTSLSPAAAKCLAYCNDTDLFLNRLKELSPQTAKHLFQWKGNWICLNGLRDLSSDTARYVFQWTGGWISLNGLQTISPGVSRHIARWPGNRLELMGLDAKRLSAGDPQILKDLRRWQNNGGALYTSSSVLQALQHDR